MRTFIAALLGATAVLPALVHAMPTRPDPADPAASVPAVNVPSVFADYRPYREQKTPGWQLLNRAVASPSGGAGMNHGQMHLDSDTDDANDVTNDGDNDGDNDDQHGAHHEEPAK
ncbi:hypothetical protein [Paraburkholderia fungorum]|uniref:hypothetical protein n=1 Tax=Paraburkholderia fungorum TaxID=134537 RepID=UPI0020A80A8C|nr:hypothetical protein [Paraburkholderia fungorum]